VLRARQPEEQEAQEVEEDEGAGKEEGEAHEQAPAADTKAAARSLHQGACPQPLTMAIPARLDRCQGRVLVVPALLDRCPVGVLPSRPRTFMRVARR
jgi:hypothetical protein